MTISDYSFTLPFPPSVNSWKTPFKGRMILTVRGRAYRAAVIKEMERQGLSGEFLSGDLEVHITLNPPTLRRYDCDNFAKSLLDALTHAGFWIDDSQIQILTIKKGLKVAGGGVDVKVSLLSGD